MEVAGLDAAILSISVFGVAFVLIFYGIWQKQRIDVARRKLFAVRDEIFILFANSEHSVRHPEHVRIRNSLNRMIRYAHMITWIQALVVLFVLKNEDRGPAASISSDIGDPKLQAKLNYHIRHAYEAVIWLMIHRSLLLLIFDQVHRLFSRMANWWERWQPKLERISESIFASAEMGDDLASCSQNGVRS